MNEAAPMPKGAFGVPTPTEADRRLLSIPVELIEADDRLRPLAPEKVAEIAASFRDQGQITPIEVTPTAGNGFRLIAGGHRLAAAKQAGWDSIEAVVFSGTPDEVRLREIDENLCRHELNPLDQAVFLRERKLIYERLHPETRRGAAGDPLIAKMADRAPSYAAATAKALGLSLRAIFRGIRRAADLHPDAFALLRGTPLAEKASAIDALLDVPRERQCDVIRALLSDATDRPRTVVEARRLVLRERAPEPVTPLDRVKKIIDRDDFAVADRRALYAWLAKTYGFGAGRGGAA